MKYLSKVVAAAVLGFTLAGCTGTAMKTQQYDASQYTVLGHSEASATGIMLLGVIPIGQNNPSCAPRMQPSRPKAATR